MTDGQATTGPNPLEAARRGVVGGTRVAYFGVQSGLAQVTALQPREKGDATVVLRGGATAPCSRTHRPALLERLGRAPYR